MKPYDFTQGLPPLDEVLKGFTSKKSEAEKAQVENQRIFDSFYDHVQANPFPSPVDFSERIALVSLDAKVNDVIYMINPQARPFDAFVEYHFWRGDGWEHDFRDGVVPAVSAIAAKYPEIEIAFLVLNNTSTMSALTNKYLPNITHKRVLQVTNPPSAMVKNIIDISCKFRHY